MRDIVVIGAGPAGLSCAISSGILGIDVLLVEEEKIGGDCTHYGCVPSKTLLKCAEVAHTARTSERFGIDASLDDVDLGTVMDHVQATIDGIAAEETPEELARYGVDVMFGHASFVDPHTISVDGEEIKAKKVVICTGSTPFVPPIEGLDDVDYLTNRNVFELEELPSSLGIIGSGPIGSEMAQAFARLGSDVVMFEGQDQILTREDADVAELLMERFREEGVTMHTNVHVEKVEQNKKTVSLVAGDIRERVEQVLVATGQRPHTEGLHLDAAGVETTERGHVETNSKLQTDQSHIYAAGDVVGPYQFTHMAEEMAKVVVWNVFSPWKTSFNDDVVPWTTYTDPELARVGMNESQAREHGYTVHTLEGKEVDRFRTEGYEDGIIKLVTHKGRIKGVTALLPRAGEVIQEYVLAMKQGLKADTIADTVHTYPTMTDANKWVAYEYVQDKLRPWMKWFLQWSFRIA